MRGYEFAFRKLLFKGENKQFLRLTFFHKVAGAALISNASVVILIVLHNRNQNRLPSTICQTALFTTNLCDEDLFVCYKADKPDYRMSEMVLITCNSFFDLLKKCHCSTVISHVRNATNRLRG